MQNYAPRRPPFCILHFAFCISLLPCRGFFRTFFLGDERPLRDRLVDQLLQLFAGLEVRDLLRRHFRFLAGLRIAAGARLAVAETEASESAELDLLSGAERLDDGIEDDVDDRLRLFL